ncbi:hypothetical protein BLOT_002807 [Blomia tropicalis]|nr:hypothetical protein BLOT_002807 [Blomia tropicalis]
MTSNDNESLESGKEMFKYAWSATNSIRMNNLMTQCSLNLGTIPQKEKGGGPLQMTFECSHAVWLGWNH